VPLRKFSTSARNTNGIKSNFTPVKSQNMFLNTIVV